MYTNAFSKLSKALKSNLPYSTLAEAQLVVAKLFNFSSTNAVSGSLKTATGKLKKSNSTAESVELEEYFLEPQFRAPSLANKQKKPNRACETYDELMSLFFVLDEWNNEGFLELPLFAVCIENEEYVIEQIEYSEEKGITLNLYTVCNALTSNHRITNLSIPNGFINQILEDDLSRSQPKITITVDDKFNKRFNPSKDKLEVFYFNSKVVHALSDRSEVSVNRIADMLHDNFNALTYNDLLEMSKGIPDQPLMVEKTFGKERWIIPTDGVSMTEGTLVIRLEQRPYEEAMHWNRESRTKAHIYPSKLLNWHELAESITSLPSHQRAMPVRFQLVYDAESRKYVVPCGVDFHLNLASNHDDFGAFKIIVPRTK